MGRQDADNNRIHEQDRNNNRIHEQDRNNNRIHKQDRNNNRIHEQDRSNNRIHEQDRNNNRICGCGKASEPEETASTTAAEEGEGRDFWNDEGSESRRPTSTSQVSSEHQRHSRTSGSKSALASEKSVTEYKTSRLTVEAERAEAAVEAERTETPVEAEGEGRTARAKRTTGRAARAARAKAKAKARRKALMEAAAVAKTGCVCHKRRCRHCGFVCPCFEQNCPSCSRPFRSFVGLRDARRSSAPRLRRRRRLRAGQRGGGDGNKGKRHLNEQVKCNHSAMVRVGGGFVTLVDYLKSHNKVVLSNVKRQTGPAFLSPQFPHYAGRLRRGQPRGVRYVSQAMQHVEEVIFAGREPGRLKCEC